MIPKGFSHFLFLERTGFPPQALISRLSAIPRLVGVPLPIRSILQSSPFDQSAKTASLSRALPLSYVQLLTFLLLLLFTFACSQKEATKTLRLAHGMDPSQPVHQAMVHMAEQVEEISEGQLAIKIYHSQQLGAQRDLIELLQIGSLDMMKTSAAVLENFSPLVKVFNLPYLYKDSIHEATVMQGPIGQKILEGGVPYQLRGLCYYDAGKRSFYTTEKPIHEPGDLEGLNIRVQPSVTAIELIKAFGGGATAISFGELYTALQQGVVDGAENNAPSFYYTRHYEVCKYYTINEHTAVPDVLLISEHTWQKLSEKEKDWLKKAVQESVAFQKKLWKSAEQEALQAVEAAGVTIIRPEKEPFARKVEGLAYKLIEEPEVLELYQQIKDAN